MRPAPLAVVLALAVSLCAPSTVEAAPPTGVVEQVSVEVTDYGLEFRWAMDLPAGARVEIEYVGCGGQLAGRYVQEFRGRGFYVTPVYANPHKMGADWSRILTISQPDKETVTEEVVNTDPDLAFDCSGEEPSMVKHWSRPLNVPDELAAGARIDVTDTLQSDFGHYREVVPRHAWMIGDEVVSRRLALRIDEAWARQELSFVATVASSTVTQTKTLSFGTILERRVVARARVKRLGYSWTTQAVGKVEGAAGLQVYVQVADCDVRRTPDWQNLVRQTTTRKGTFNFGARGAKAKRTYRTRHFRTTVDPFENLARFYIPASDGYASYAKYRGCVHFN